MMMNKPLFWGVAMLAMLLTSCYSNERETLAVQFDHPFIHQQATDIAQCPYLGFAGLRNFKGHLTIYCDTVNPPLYMVDSITTIKEMANNKLSLANQLSPSTTYYWRCAMIDTLGAAHFSSTYSFTTISLSSLEHCWELVDIISPAGYKVLHRGLPKKPTERIEGDMIKLCLNLSEATALATLQGAPKLSTDSTLYYSFDGQYLQLGDQVFRFLNLGYLTRYSPNDKSPLYLILERPADAQVLVYKSLGG